MVESSAGDFTVGKIQKTRRQQVAKMYGQQKRNIIHMSSTAYEQDHSAAKQRDEIASPHSITSSAATSSLSSTVMPSIRAVRGTAVQFEHSKQSARRERAIGCAMQTGRRPIVERVQQ
jgi:hypothetical protein